MQKNNWLVVGTISAVVFLLLFGGGMMMSGGVMMGYGGYGMMGNWGYSPFSWVGILFMGLISIGVIALTVLGVIWLVRKTGNATPPSS